jgi:hypothetical protein
MLTDEVLKKYIPEIKKELGIKVYTPLRYFQGIKTKKAVKQRIQTIYQNVQDAKKDVDKPEFYKKFSTDADIKTKKSSWTEKFHAKYGEQMKDLKEKYPKKDIFKRIDMATGLNASLLKESYKRGVAAYKTGHRPGATAEQWGYARMYSLIIRYKQKTLTHDKDLAKKLQDNQ